MADRLDVPAGVANAALTPHEKGLDGVALGNATALGDDVTAVSVEETAPAPATTVSGALITPAAMKALVFMYNRIIQANTGMANSPSQKSRLFNNQESAKVARISQGRELNPNAPKLTTGGLREMLALFALMDRRGVLQKLNIRKEDMAVYAKLTGKGTGFMHRLLSSGPFRGRRRRPLGLYNDLNGLLRPVPSGKRTRTVYITGQKRTEELDMSSRPVDPALAPETAAKPSRRLRRGPMRMMGPKRYASLNAAWQEHKRPQMRPRATPRGPQRTRVLEPV